jgi:outer membrane biosynthesis protein TonB
MAIQRKKRNSAKTNLVVSFVFHAAIIAALVFLAAREGYLGKKLKTIAVTMAPKEKPPEKPKEEVKPPEPKAEPPKTEEPKAAVANLPPPPAAAPPPTGVAPVAAPPPTALPGFAFTDGAKAVETTSDPVQLYRGFVEFALRSKWIRPEGVADESYVAEVELAVDPKGNVTGSDWKRGSGHAVWDDSVRRAVAATKALSRPPPKGFPGKFLVRFDVVAEADATSPLALP